MKQTPFHSDYFQKNFKLLKKKMNSKAIKTLIGGIIVHLTLGIGYTTANLATYVISYLHVVKGFTVINL